MLRLFVICSVLTVSMLAVAMPSERPEFSTDENIGTGSPFLESVPHTNLDERFISCPVLNTNQPRYGAFRGNLYEYLTASEVDYERDNWEARISSNWNALDGLIDEDINAVVIDIRRVKGEPAYLYLGNKGNQNDIYEPWSASKILAVSAAISKVRELSSGTIGAAAKVNDMSVGDMITAIHSYKALGSIPKGASNSLARYFLDVATRDYATGLMGDLWLKVNDDSRFRGGYGKPRYFNRALWVNHLGDQIMLDPNGAPQAADKDMSALVQAEWIRRLIHHDHEPLESRMPHLTSEDIEIILYGDEFKVGLPGGMNAGAARYIAQALAGGKHGEPSEIKKCLKSTTVRTGGFFTSLVLAIAIPEKELR